MDDHYEYGCIIRKYPNSKSLVHLNRYVLGENTILGETISRNILFASRDCTDIRLTSSLETIVVKFNQSYDLDMNDTDDFSCHQIYDRKRCVFECLHMTPSSEIHCFGCCEKSIIETSKYSIGDCVLLPRDNSDIELPLYKYFDDNNISHQDLEFDDELYPEKWRKRKCRSDSDVYNPNDSLLYGYVEEIIADESGDQLKLKMFFRPENIFENFEDYQKNKYCSNISCTSKMSSIFCRKYYPYVK
ncbi:hypothetical protein BLA29_006842 [Euroglyphus maynei]|uniref:BAH domain-containing protein n=1 Tax=Euroglyphus maynei TaxID=6958 RepID=A0A1Y3B772_EURMA|nr:hypothetical protein BLA29_006842 [Euroglyphus maynei]